MTYYDRILHEIDVNKVILAELEEHVCDKPDEVFQYYRKYKAGKYILELDMKPNERRPEHYSVGFVKVNVRYPYLNQNCGSLILTLAELVEFIETLNTDRA